MPAKEQLALTIPDEIQAKITEALNERGVEIKRRTVAKYRESLGIESQARRRWTVQTGADD